MAPTEHTADVFASSGDIQKKIRHLQHVVGWKGCDTCLRQFPVQLEERLSHTLGVAYGFFRDEIGRFHAIFEKPPLSDSVLAAVIRSVRSKFANLPDFEAAGCIQRGNLNVIEDYAYACRSQTYIFECLPRFINLMHAALRLRHLRTSSSQVAYGKVSIRDWNRSVQAQGAEMQDAQAERNRRMNGQPCGEPNFKCIYETITVAERSHYSLFLNSPEPEIQLERQFMSMYVPEDLKFNETLFRLWRSHQYMDLTRLESLEKHLELESASQVFKDLIESLEENVNGLHGLATFARTAWHEAKRTPECVETPTTPLTSSALSELGGGNPF